MPATALQKHKVFNISNLMGLYKWWTGSKSQPRWDQRSTGSPKGSHGLQGSPKQRKPITGGYCEHARLTIFKFFTNPACSIGPVWLLGRQEYMLWTEKTFPLLISMLM